MATVFGKYCWQKIWKHPKCSSAEEWMKKMVHTHNETLLSPQKNESLPFAAMWMDLESMLLSEICQRQILYAITCM